MSILVTGAAGFIGSKVCELLAKSREDVIGIDNINNYYDVKVKKYRLDGLKKLKNIKFYKADIEKKKISKKY
ncbi:hypothetical protein AGMMS49950_03270 [Endomicrobiia bacterium]|nr:hypothetical protein AGMMS49531_01020 [Endomicrobiia bacterium]GHT64384.1 hypothetical protein AGMMS49556_02380 [Endomicrobiia bacterium]GHT69792.1 hypothetical protein AGMMS49950_03270 [Endomicrobiia bacterium]